MKEQNRKKVARTLSGILRKGALITMSLAELMAPIGIYANDIGCGGYSGENASEEQHGKMQSNGQFGFTLKPSKLLGWVADHNDDTLYVDLPDKDGKFGELDYVILNNKEDPRKFIYPGEEGWEGYVEKYNKEYSKILPWD
jgi:hypothetical protein